jgi:DNA-binding transcriptional MerR regulator
MIKIGDFSRLTQIGIHALRNYDSLGLLKPEHTDKFTGYRYYTLQQLPRAHRIMALKEMGLSLEQIGIMLNQEINIDQLRGMFQLKQAEIEQRVREDQQRLSMIEFHLHMIELEDNMPDLNVVMKDINSFKALYMRIPGTDIDNVVDIQREITEALASNNIETVGPPVNTLFGDEVNLDNVDHAFGIPVPDGHTEDLKLPTKGTLTVRDMPPVKAATIVVDDGSREEDLEKTILLQRWAIENGYSLCNEKRIVFFKGPMDNIPRSEWLWELQVIVEPQSEES